MSNFGDRQERTASRARVRARRGKTLRERFSAGIVKAKRNARGRREAKKPTGIIRGAIETIIDELREKEKWSFRERHGKKDFHEYLKDVYIRRHWAEQFGMKVAALYEIPDRKDKTPIRIIIDASSGEPDRQQTSGGTGPRRSRDKYRRQLIQRNSRWVRALEYLAAKKVPASEFIEFLDKNGGVQGCADKMAALEKERAKPRKKKARW